MQGRLLGIDYGRRRWGLVYSDELGVAVPLPAAVQATHKERLQAVCELVKERRIEGLVVGLPLHMSGEVGEMAEEAKDFMQALSSRTGLPVEAIDERLTSRQAEEDLAATGRKARGREEQERYRKTGDLDSRAACLLLQDYVAAHQPADLPPPPEDEDFE